MKPRLGFLGVGWIGRQRMSAIVDSGLASVAAICDPDAACLEESAKIVPEAAVFSDYAKMLELNFDGVVIATPSGLHAGQTIRALERGAAVFCQKPLARSASEIGEMIDCAKRHDLLLGVDLSYRHLEGLRDIRKRIRAGDLGDVFCVRMVFHNAYGPGKAWFYNPQLSGGGCVVDLGIHLVDAVLWVLETQAVAVRSRIFSEGKAMATKPDAVEDFASIQLDLASGAMAGIECSWKLHAGQDAQIEMTFHGTLGGATVRNVAGSFFDFQTELFRGTQREILFSPPEDWPGRAAVAWAQQLADSRAYDPEIERQLQVAAILDQVYGNAALP